MEINLVSVFLCILYLMSIVAKSKNDLKKSETGRNLLLGIENRTISILRWRSEANVYSDLKSLKNLLLKTMLAIILFTLLLFQFEIKPNIVLSYLFVFNALLFFSLEWFLDIRKVTFGMAGYMILITGTPFLLWGIGRITGIDTLGMLRTQLYLFPWSDLTEYEFLSRVTVFAGISSLFFLLIWLLINLIPSIILFSLIYLTNKVSFSLVNLKENEVRSFFDYAYILIPVYFMLKSVFFNGT